MLRKHFAFNLLYNKFSSPKVNSLDGSLFFYKKLKILCLITPPYLQIVTIIIIVEVITMRKFIENTGFWLLVITCLALFAIIISGFFGIQRYLVVSGSMEPNLYAGDIVFVNTNIDFEDVEIGDVIIFKYEDMNIIHRVIEADGQKLKTKGDANKDDDGFVVTAENFVGKALFHIDKIGYAVDFKNQIKERK